MAEQQSQHRHQSDENDALLPPTEHDDEEPTWPSASESPSSRWSEALLLIRQSPPLIVTYLLQYFHCILTAVIAGHLSADDLAASSIGATTIAIFGSAFVEGMATALDTLCAQTHGAGDLHGVGHHVQRMVLLMAIVCIPIGAVWMASPALLSLVVKQPELARKAGQFLRVSFIGLPFQALFEAVKRFLQVQGDFHSAMFIVALCTPVNAVLSWVFAFHLGLGLDGVALGSSLSQALRSFLLLVYIVWLAPWSHACWGGLLSSSSPQDLFRGWRRMVRLSAAGSLAILAEYAAFEIISFSASYLSTEHLAAQSILTTISIVSWHIPFSVSVVSSTRLGHLIGAGQVGAAKRAAIVHWLAFVVIGCLSAVLTALLREQLPHIFTNDGRVLAICAQTIGAVSIFQIVESVLCGTNGLLRGLGRQSVAAYVVFAVNYLAAVPISVWLELGPPAWELNGFWIGLPSGMVVIVCIELLYMRLIRWESCVEVVREQGL